MRLYRGLTEPYRAERVVAGAGGSGPFGAGTDFTDCPYTALQYARARRGCVLVLDVVAEASPPRVTEELWPNSRAKRLMVWGPFDDFIVANIPASQLRGHVRRKGIVAASDEHKTVVLRDAVEDWIEHAGASASRSRRAR
jgi:hypothetical protein